MKVIGYTRVSTAEQAKDGWTLSQQRKLIESECERRGWELVEVIEDAGFSGRTDDRPGLRRALSMLAKRKAKGIVVARLDRLARSLINLAEWIDLSAKQKWAIVALDHELNTTTANGRLVARIIASVAQWESEINGERVRDGMAEARATKVANGEVVRWGFQRRTPPQVVARIVKARKRGDSFAAIAQRLDRQRVPTPGNGKRWYPSTVRGIYNTETTIRRTA
jgi:DNA invertase Pin-like site-specific DNA recombinase